VAKVFIPPLIFSRPFGPLPGNIFLRGLLTCLCPPMFHPSSSSPFHTILVTFFGRSETFGFHRVCNILAFSNQPSDAVLFLSPPPFFSNLARYLSCSFESFNPLPVRLSVFCFSLTNFVVVGLVVLIGYFLLVEFFSSWSYVHD